MSSADDDPGSRVVREIARQLAEKDGPNEWRLWIFVLIAALAVVGILVTGTRLFVMRRFS